MVLDARLKIMENTRGALNSLIYPIQLLVSAPFELGGWLVQNLSSRQGLMAENESLRAQNDLVRAQLQKLASLEVENSRLRNLLDSTYKIADKVIIAEILAVDLEPFTQQIVINKGNKDNSDEMENVYPGQALIDAEGIVGQIVHVGYFSSTVMLISDPNSSIPVRVNRNGLRAIANGNGSNDQLELVHIPNNADIKPGDILVSSGLGQRYPPGYPTAVVTKVFPDPSQSYATVYARPLAKLSQISNVLLVKPQEQDLPTPEETEKSE